GQPQSAQTSRRGAASDARSVDTATLQASGATRKRSCRCQDCMRVALRNASSTCRRLLFDLVGNACRKQATFTREAELVAAVKQFCRTPQSSDELIRKRFRLVPLRCHRSDRKERIQSRRKDRRGFGQLLQLIE